MRQLLESDFPIHRKNQDGQTAFHLAVHYGYHDIVLVMIDFVEQNRSPK